MLEYFKTVLSKVSFDFELFEKELKKALLYLLPAEAYQLKDWCYNEFDEAFEGIFDRCFTPALN
jgi:hypothetical protein